MPWQTPQVFDVFFIYCLLTAQGVSIIEPVDDAVAARGHEHFWHCITTPVAAPLNYSWKHNDARILSSATRRVHYNGTLYIRSVDTADIGEYQCVVSQGVQTVFSKVVNLRLAVLDAAFQMSPSNCSELVRHRCLFSCYINSIPRASITWLVNGNLVEAGEQRQTDNGTALLEIRSLSYSYTGEYRCLALNPVSGVAVLSHPAYLTVSGAPELRSVSGAIQSIECSTVFIDCLPISNPPARIIWSRQGGDNVASIYPYHIYSNGTLRLDCLTKELAGFYTCTASNSFGAASYTLLVSILDDPTPPTFTSTPVDTDVAIGTSLLLTCTATGNPEPKVTWADPYNQTVVSRAGSLELTDVSVSHNGTWACTAENLIGRIMHRFNLRIFKKPEIQNKSYAITSEEGKRITLDCVCSGIPQPTISWEIPGNRTLSLYSPLGGFGVKANGSLVILQVAKAFGGRYTCTCTNRVGSDSLTAIIIVHYKPSFLARLHDVRAIVGRSLTVGCRLDGWPQPQILWYRNDLAQPIVSDNVYTLYPNGSLGIHTVRLNVHGNYTCLGRNYLGQVQTSMVLTVLSPPIASVRPDYLIVKAGDSLSLTCSVNSSTGYSVNWQRNMMPVIEDGNLKLLDNHSLYIRSITSTMFGEYTCVVTNEIASVTASALVTDKEGPQWLRMPSNQSVPVHKEVSISCQAASHSPLTYTWYFQIDLFSSASLIRSSGPDGNLTIQNVTRANRGFYTCVAQDRSKSIQASSYLTVIELPKLVYKNESAIVSEKEDVLMECRFDCSNVLCNATWIDPQQRLVGYGRQLLRLNVSVGQHWGNWLCRACSIAGCFESVVFLQVLGRPMLANYTISATNDNVQLTCQFKGSPSPQIHFYNLNTNLLSAFMTGHSTQLVPNGITLVIDRSSVGYSYRCIAINAYGEDGITLQRPAKVKNVTVVTTSSSFKIIWPYQQVVPAIKQYVIQHEYHGSTTQTIMNPSNLYYTANSLPPYSHHTIVLVAENVLGSSERLESRITTLPEAPSAPGNLSVNLVSRTCQLLIRWQSPLVLNGSPDDIEYELIITSPSSLTTPVVTTDTTVVYYIPSPGVFLISLRAYNSKAYGAVTHSQVVRTSSTVESSDVFRPVQAPVNVTASINNQVVTVQWQPFIGIKTYVVKYVKYNGEVKDSFVDMSTQVTLTIQYSGQYSISVAAVNTAGVGVFSPTLEITIPEKPKYDNTTVTARSRSQDYRIDLEGILAILFGCVLFIVIIVVLTIAYLHRKRSKYETGATPQIVYHSRSNEDHAATLRRYKTQELIELDRQKLGTPNGSKRLRNITNIDYITPDYTAADQFGVEKSAPSLVLDEQKVHKSFETSKTNPMVLYGVQTTSDNIKVILSGPERAVDVIGRDSNYLSRESSWSSNSRSRHGANEITSNTSSRGVSNGLFESSDYEHINKELFTSPQDGDVMYLPVQRRISRREPLEVSDSTS